MGSLAAMAAAGSAVGPSQGTRVIGYLYVQPDIPIMTSLPPSGRAGARGRASRSWRNDR
jgi:hypothetical protein